MSLQIIWFVECLGAIRTTKGLLLCVHFHMFMQTVRSSEGFFTQRTSESFLLCMNYKMIFPVAFFRKRLGTDRTHIRILPGVTFNMKSKAIQTSKTFRTVVTLINLFFCPKKTQQLNYSISFHCCVYGIWTYYFIYEFSNTSLYKKFFLLFSV